MLILNELSYLSYIQKKGFFSYSFDLKDLGVRETTASPLAERFRFK